MKSASTMSPYKVGIRPVVSSASSYTTTHIMVLCLERSIDLDAASLEVKPLSIAIDYTYATWDSVDGVGRKCRPI